MKTINLTKGILAITLVALTVTSCKEVKKEQHIDNEHHSDGSHDDSTMDSSNDMMGNDQHASKSTTLVANYLELKNALVADDKDGAAKAGGMMVSAFNDFETSSFGSEEQQELKDIIEDAKEHAEHIEKSPIDHQREHFDVLSKDMIDLIAITGTEEKLYQDFCPMYNKNKGAQWLSATKEIKNPYYGAKMMGCGSVQKEIN